MRTGSACSYAFILDSNFPIPSQKIWDSRSYEYAEGTKQLNLIQEIQVHQLYTKWKRVVIN